MLAMLLVASGCQADPPPGAGSSASASNPGTATPTVTSTPTPTARPPLKPMRQPSKPYPSPSPRPLPAHASELDHMTQAMQKLVWAALGSADPKTSSTCTTTSKALVAASHPVHFHCRITASGVTTTFRVVATKKTDSIAYRFRADRLPVSKKKVDYEAARQVFDPARIRCDADDARLVLVGDPDAIVCWVWHPNRTRTRYFGELDRFGLLTFRTEAQVRALHSPRPTPTPVKKATKTPSTKTSKKRVR